MLECQEAGQTFEVLYAINLSDTELKRQTRRRLAEWGLTQHVTLIHHAELNRTSADESKSRRLIVIDECHIALGDDCPFHNFLKRFGVEYGLPINTWSNPDIWVLSVTATPFAHKINNAFEEVWLETVPQYYSLKKMQEAGRIHKSELLVTKKGEITDFCIERLDAFSKTDGGVLLLRLNGKDRVSSLTAYIEKNYDFEVEDFSSQGEQAIEDLSEELLSRSKAPVSCPLVAIIRGGLRAGKTLKTTKGIQMVLESPNAKDDATCQALLGRCLGYECEDGHDRHTDTFPIYCNNRHIPQIIKWYETKGREGGVPSGNYNKRVKEHATVWKMRVLNDIPKNCRTCSANNGRDIADDVRRGKTEGSGVFHLDGPNPNYQDSWDRLPDHLKGKYVAFDAVFGEDTRKDKLQPKVLCSFKGTPSYAVFTYKLRDLEANGIPDNEGNGFTVLRGSQVSLHSRKSASQATIKARLRLVESGVLKLIGDYFEFTKDLHFNSPSAAAYIIAGGNVDGQLAWINNRNETLKQFKAFTNSVAA